MKTPVGVRIREFTKAREEWIRTHCVTDGEWQRCTTCGERILIRKTYISIHHTEFGDHHAGTGQVAKMVVPYCPKCEPVPDEIGCFHEEYAVIIVQQHDVQ